jgi:LuxR family transcriptional regulator, maltose regulon positive regulatory protein
VALLRARGQVVEVGVTELAMNQAEGRALLEAAGVGLADPEVSELVGRAEGWPVGLYLAALAHKAGGQRGKAGFAFAGDDRFLADYLHAELLAHLPPERVAFLTRTAVLERMCAPLCDAILDTRGSDRVLAELEDSNLLVVPLDRRREWYRYHQLFRELLLAELQRRQPELVAELHTRAARWCEANGLEVLAVDHAQAAGDADRVARLVAGLVFRAWTGGRVETVQRWLGWFEERALVERYPTVAVLGALIQALVVRPVAAERWADAAEHQTTAPDADAAAQTPPDGGSMEGYLAMLRGLLCLHGVGRMRADAQAALAGLSPASPWRTATMVIQAMAELLDGQADQADATLAHAVEVGRLAGALPAVSSALAERCLLAIARDDWAQADALAEQALEIVTAGRLDDYIMSLLVHVAAARTALHRGAVPAGQGAPGSGRPPAAAAHPRDPCDGRAYAAGAGAGLPAAGRPCRRQGGPAAGARRPAATTQPRRLARAGPGAVVGNGQGAHRDPGGIVAHHCRVASAPAVGHPPVVPGDRPAAVHLPAHGQDPGDLHLPQARRLLPQPGGPTPTRPQPDRVLALV